MIVRKLFSLLFFSCAVMCAQGQALIDSLQDVVTQSHNVNEVARASGDLGRLMANAGRYSEAEAYIKRAYQLNNRKGNNAGLQDNFTQLARLYFAQKRYSEARWYYLQAKRVATERQNDEDVVQSVIGLATVHAQGGDLFSARRDLREAQTLARDKGLLAQLIEIEKLQVRIREKEKAGRTVTTAVNKTKK
ncbi:MAG: hypothetical protein INR69_16830 [Mucilaginibacter polytrichastri]|nr:hypothetical protein [Mucilaginibacter polytrichastri]